MKKFLVILVVICCAFATFAEGKNSISVKAAPYAGQMVTINRYPSTKSTYGLGAELSYQRFLVKGLFIEGGIGGDYMIYSNSSKFANLMAFTGVGYKCTVKSFFSTIHFDIAGDLSYNRGAYTKSLGIKFGTGFGFNLTKLLSVSLSCDAAFTYYPVGARVGVQSRILPFVGIEFTF